MPVQPSRAAKRNALMPSQNARPAWRKTARRSRRAGGSSAAAGGLAVAGTLRSLPLPGPSKRTRRPTIFRFVCGAARVRPACGCRAHGRPAPPNEQTGRGLPVPRRGRAACRRGLPEHTDGAGPARDRMSARQKSRGNVPRCRGFLGPPLPSFAAGDPTLWTPASRRPPMIRGL